MPSVVDLGARVRGWFQRAPKIVTPRTILIVDGNPAHRQSTARLVESLGYHALQANGVGEAVEQLADPDVHPESVLLGFDLQDASGLEALDQIRGLDPNQPVVMLAADLWDSRVAEAMRRGAIAYLPRPFGADDLRELLGRR
jgi:NtrC-family two-component system response regulator AlgB